MFSISLIDFWNVIMNERMLRYFVDIVDFGGFVRAANRIPITQSTLSKAVTQLESELGCCLLERGRRGTAARLTQAGQLVYERAKELLKAHQLLREDLQSLQNLGAGILKLGLAPLGSSELFAAVIARFRSLHPAITIQLMEQGGHELENAVRAGEVELALTLLPVNDDLDWLFVCEAPLVLAVSDKHPLASHSSAPITALREESIVVLEGASALNGKIRDAALEHGFTIKEGQRCGHLAFSLSLVASNAGLMILPAFITEHHKTPGIVSVPLQTNVRWQLAVIWRQNAALSAAARQWLSLVKQHIVNNEDMAKHQAASLPGVSSKFSRNSAA